MAYIFISYNRESKVVVKTLVDDIQALGHTVWFDQELSGGQVWWDQILATVRDCDVFVFVLSPEALNSTACKREYDYAADLGKPILPVMVSGGVSPNLMPPALSQIQFVDYRQKDRDAALRLARALISVPPPEPLPDPLPAPPEAPISYLGSLTGKIETTTTLSYEEQSALVVDLKKSLRNSDATDDIRALLERFRKRRDLLATIAEEIDELLANTRNASPVPPRASEPEPPPREPSPGAPSAEKRPVTPQPEKFKPQPPSPPLKEEPLTPQKPRKTRVASPIVIVLISIVAGWVVSALAQMLTNTLILGYLGWLVIILVGIVLALKVSQGKDEVGL